MYHVELQTVQQKRGKGEQKTSEETDVRDTVIFYSCSFVFHIPAAILYGQLQAMYISKLLHIPYELLHIFNICNGVLKSVASESRFQAGAPALNF